MQVTSKGPILLIYPPYFRLIGEQRIWYPLGLGYLSSYLKADGFSTVVYNADAETRLEEKVIPYREKFYESKKIVTNAHSNSNPIWNELKEVLKRTNPKIIGISILTETMPLIGKITSLCKEFSQNAPVILGGPHTTVDIQSLSHVDNWDYAVVGEAETSFSSLVKQISSGKSPSADIGGLVRREGSKLIINGDFAAYRGRLDFLPFPEICDMFDFNSQVRGKMKKTMISTSRGCPFRCTFCYMNIYRRKTRFRTAKNVTDEIKLNMDNYGISKFYFNDDSFGVNRKFLKDFSEIVKKEKLEIKWSCMTHEKIVNPENLRLMKEAGCDSIHIGIESGSDRILSLLRKKTTVDRIIKKCKLITDFGIKVKAFFMFGIPSEREEDLRKSISLVEQIKPYEAILQVYVPYPKTELWNYITQKYGDPAEFYNWESFYKSKINYAMFPEISPQTFDNLVEEFFSVVENINKTNRVY